MATWQVLARMPDRTVGGVLQGVSFTLSLKFNEVGTWTLSVPREATPEGWPAPGAGCIFQRDGEVVASGMLDNESFDWTSEAGQENSGPGSYAMTGDTDLGRIAYRIVYPSPAVAWGTGQADYYIETPDRPEERLRVLVSKQAGPAAQTARQVAGLTIAADTAIPGDNYSIRERFTPLLDACRKVADFGGLRFDVVDQLNGNMQFEVHAITDLSGQVVFGIDFGNVTTLHAERVAPTASVALVAGGGELDNRSLHEYANEDSNVAWGRREVFLDQRQVGEDAGEGAPTEEQEIEYEKAALEALTEGQEQTGVSTTVLDTEAVQWKRDYNLGDKVTVLTPFGSVPDLVRGVDITVDEKGNEDIVPVVGLTDVTIENPLLSVIRKMLQRVSQLERGY